MVCLYDHRTFPSQPVHCISKQGACPVLWRFKPHSCWTGTVQIAIFCDSAVTGLRAGPVKYSLVPFAQATLQCSELLPEQRVCIAPLNSVTCCEFDTWKESSRESHWSLKCCHTPLGETERPQRFGPWLHSGQLLKATRLGAKIQLDFRRQQRLPLLLCPGFL